MNVLEEIMKEISGSFLSDSSQYLERFVILKNVTFTNIGTRSKLLVDLMFSIECSLKSLIFIESNTDEKDTYKKVKKCSHYLVQLINKLNKSTEIQQIERYILSNNIDKINIACRYSLEANIEFRENGLLSNKYYNTIADSAWIDKLYNEVVDLNNYVIKCFDQKFNLLQTTTLNNINIADLLEIEDRIKNIAI